MPATYEPIATTTLSSAASSITFSSIPGTYTDLRIALVGTMGAGGGGRNQVTFNSDTGTNYSRTFIYGDGSAVTSARNTSATNITADAGGFSDTIPTLVMLDIFNYAGSTNKTLLANSSGDRNGSGLTMQVVGLWRSTSAITTVTLTSSAGNWNSGTTATLYGILKA